MKRPAGLLLLGATGVLAVVAAWRWTSDEPPAEVVAAGETARWWWSLDAAAADPVAADERARELSLPYTSAGARAAGGAGGVRVLRRELVAPGHNLYVSAHGPEAMLVDVDGRPLWRWRYPFEKAFPDKAPTVETSFWRRVRLLPGGDLLVLVQGGGVFCVDRNSQLRWKSRVSAYNDLEPTPDGGALTLIKEVRRIPGLHEGREVLEDILVELGPDGAERRRVSILRALLASPWAPWLPPAGEADLLHSNTVVPLDGSLAAFHPAFAAGNVLLSLREISALVVLDPRTGQLVHALRGPWRRQHQPMPLAKGEIVLFDNVGRPGGGGRVLAVHPADGRVLWEHPPAGEPALRSSQAGSVQPLPGGNLLIVESEAGRAREITATGEVVWELSSPHRMGDRNQFVAYLFDVQRVPAVDWLEPAPEKATKGQRR